MGFREHFSNRVFNTLRPKTWICVGQGFAREDIKEYLLEQKLGFTKDVVVNVQILCIKLLGPEIIPDTKRILTPLARQEILRLLLADARLNQRMPELKRLRRQTGFYKRLDRAMQSGRMAFAHSEEQRVYSERLEKNSGINPIRAEVELMSIAYEAWLESESLWDPPLLMRKAIERLDSLEPVQGLPEELLYFTAVTSESLEDQFWDSLSRHVSVVPIRPQQVSADLLPGESTGVSTIPLEQWHTLDDAAESLADRLADILIKEGTLSHHSVLMPDIPQVRRTIKRAFYARGLSFSDPRDPTRLRWEESLKWALLPLEMVTKNFERPKVVSYIRSLQNDMTEYSVTFKEEFPGFIREINERGIRHGLHSYAGGKLALVHERLEEISKRFSGRKTLLDLGKAHLEHLSQMLSRQPIERSQSLHWLLAFFEQVWSQFVQDMKLIGSGDLQAPPLYWFERLTARLDEASPPVERFKNKNGVQLYRLGQVPIVSPKHLWCFGLSARWLNGDGSGDYWYSEREREILGGEFSVRSAPKVRAERLAQLQCWLKGKGDVRILDADYDWDGRERDTLIPLFKVLNLQVEIEKRGAHSRWLPSHRAVRPVSALSFQLPSLGDLGRREIRATEIDRYSRCEFQGLAAGRWKLWDTREPDTDLWPDIRGNILHAAVKILLESRDDEGRFSKLPSEALAEAWILKKPVGLLQGERLARYTQKRLIATLETFCEKEREYVLRSKARVMSLEGPQLRLQLGRYDMIGIPDRIDSHPQGLFVMDYKTSTSLPSGQEMVDLGYRMQLPFYALAAQKQLRKPAAGVQFIELSKKGGRGHGIFFKNLNGKEPGKLTNTRSKLNVIEREATEVWSQCEQQLFIQADRYYAGHFTIKPKKETECRSCAFRDLCGQRRLSGDELGGSGSDNEAMG